MTVEHNGAGAGAGGSGDSGGVNGSGGGVGGVGGSSVVGQHLWRLSSWCRRVCGCDSRARYEKIKANDGILEGWQKLEGMLGLGKRGEVEHHRRRCGSRPTPKKAKKHVFSR